MNVEIRVPQLPESVADATLVAWRKQPGQSVSRDENLADLETDKVVLEVPASIARCRALRQSVHVALTVTGAGSSTGGGAIKPFNSAHFFFCSVSACVLSAVPVLSHR